MRKPRVWEPVGWFLVRRKRCRMSSSLRALGSSEATSVTSDLFLSELIKGNDVGGVARSLGGVRLGRRDDRRRRRHGLRRDVRDGEAQVVLDAGIAEGGDGRIGDRERFG